MIRSSSHRLGDPEPTGASPILGSDLPEPPDSMPRPPVLIHKSALHSAAHRYPALPMGHDLLLLFVGGFISLSLAAVFQNPLERRILSASRSITQSPYSQRLGLKVSRHARAREFLNTTEVHGVFTLLKWSPARPLIEHPDYHRIDYSAAPGQDWFDPLALRKAQADQAAAGRLGTTAYVWDMTVDHHESEPGKAFLLKAATSSFGDLNAIGECSRDAELAELVAEKLTSKGSVAFLRTMPPTRLSIQVSVVASSGRILALRRSMSVDGTQGQWTLGPNETLVPLGGIQTPGAADQSLFDLARRCLVEECSLNPGDYGPIHICWFGLSVDKATGVAQNVAAVCASPLSEAMIERGIDAAHSNFETDQVRWIPFKALDLRRAIHDRINHWADADWLSFSAVTACQVLRYRTVVEEDLRRLRRT